MSSRQSNTSLDKDMDTKDKCQKGADVKLKEDSNHTQNKDTDVSSSMEEVFKNRILVDEDKDLVNKDELDSEKHPSNVESHQSFCIDSFSSKCDEETDKWNKPVYLQTYDETLELERKEEITEPAIPVPDAPSVACFNCLGPHHMSKCAEKLDWQRITQNRKEFKNVQRNCRYYEDDDNCKKGKPGLISEALRSALNLDHHHIPIYIYKMRILGYPPGWMKEAEVENSGIIVYDSTGRDLKEENIKVKSFEPLYDQRKFIDYPGFNVHLPNNVYDEWRSLRMPPMQNRHLRSVAEKYINMVNPSSGRKRKSEGSRVKVSKKDNDKDSCTETPNRSVSNEDVKITPGGASISKSPGTPIIDTGNSVKKLPDVSNFSKDISDYMPYENLPDAVGTFEKMRIVLEKVKQALF